MLPSTTLLAWAAQVLQSSGCCFCFFLAEKYVSTIPIQRPRLLHEGIHGAGCVSVLLCPRCLSLADL